MSRTHGIKSRTFSIWKSQREWCPLHHFHVCMKQASKDLNVLVLVLVLLWLMCYKLLKNKQAAFSPSLVIHHLKSLGDRPHRFSSSLVFVKDTSLPLFSILSPGDTKYIDFSLSPSDNLVWQTPSTHERRGGRFSVNCPGSGEIRAVLREWLTVDSTSFHIEYLPVITRFLCVLILKMNSKRMRPQDRRKGVLEMVHCPRAVLWNVDT